LILASILFNFVLNYSVLHTIFTMNNEIDFNEFFSLFHYFFLLYLTKTHIVFKMNLFLDFLFNGFDDNLRIELNENYVEISEDSEAATITTNYQEIIKLISFIYSIPCSNAFTEGVFNHMKHA